MKRGIAILFFCFFCLSNFDNASAEVLKVGIVAEKPPFAYVSSPGIVEKYDGLDIAIIKAVADDLGKELILENMPFDSLIMALKTKKIDAIISALTITPERSRVISFSTPYFHSGMSMIVPDNSTIQKATDMKGKRIAVLLGATSETAVKRLGFPYDAFKTDPEAIIEVKNGKCDVFVTDVTAARRYCSNIKGIKIIEDGVTFKVEKVGIAVNKKNTQLLEKINASLAKLKDSGKMDIFLKKYTQ